jgi:predicted nucleotidyltransferase
VLFGSRARGTHQEKSDIDLAVYGCPDFIRFSLSIEESVWTLLEFDVINMDETTVSEELKTEIERDGIIVYEKV